MKESSLKTSNTPRTFLILTATLSGGPYDGREVGVLADQYKLPPPTLLLRDHPKAAYRNIPGTKTYKWWESKGNVTLLGGTPFPLSSLR